MTKEEIETEVDRYMAMSEAELLAVIECEYAKPGMAQAANDALDFLAEGIENGTIKIKP